VIVDSAAADFRQELFHDGLATQGAKKDVMYGIGLVSSLLAREQLVVTDRCQGWIDEVTDYVWDTKASERGEDKPNKDKAKDDSLDTGRYALATTEAIWRNELTA
jgi:phage terminase large subunit